MSILNRSFHKLHEYTGTLVFDLDLRHDFMWPWPFLAGDGRAHMTADEMDEQRKQNVAYEYLCHLEEAKVFVFYFVVINSSNCVYVMHNKLTIRLISLIFSCKL